jgi:hypothetical protein
MWGLNSEIPKGVLGPKAENIWKLYRAGFRVPESIFISGNAEINDELIIDILEKFSHHSKLVVRSSSVHEDGMDQSMAGLFHSVINVPLEHSALMDAMIDCRNHVPVLNDLPLQQIGLIVQEMIEPQLSGLMFTEDPTDQNSGVVIEWVYGHLESLVQGDIEGNEVRISRQDCLKGKLEYLPSPELKSITSAITQLESITSGPADIEWAISGEVCYILQIRPITSHQIGSLLGIIDLSEDNSYSTLPKRISNHHKIAFRQVCASNNLPISFGNLLTINSEIDYDGIQRAHMGWGDSMAVLLTPQRIDGGVQRISFVGSDIEKLFKFLQKIQNECARFTILTKELQETAYTGLALIDGGGGEIEIGAGHFLSKGLTDPWKFVIEDGVIGEPSDSLLPKAGIQIGVGGIQGTMDDVVPPSISELQNILGVLKIIQENYPKHCIEFGIEPNGVPFLIDHYPAEISDEESNQVLSAGSFTGKVLRIENENLFTSIDSHFHDVRVGNEIEDVILVADRPRLSLVKYLPKVRGAVGFLFENGSRLCHLAVLLRERGIPAMFVGDIYNKLVNECQVSFDTSTGLLTID